MTPEPILTLRDLMVRYPGGPAVVDGVSLSVFPGRVLSIIGESGSGKSTTLLALAGLLPREARTSGSLAMSGWAGDLLTPGNRAGLAGKEIGVIFQNPGASLNPVLRIGRQIDEVVAVHRNVARDDARAITSDLLRRVGLSGGTRSAADWAAAYPHQLSGGQKQRVAIALALAGAPRLLLADEPTTALDVTVQAQILDLLLELVDEDGLGMVFVTHDLAVAASIGDEIAVLKDGRLVESGPSREIAAQPKNAYTRKLLAASTAPVAPARPVPAGSGALALTGIHRRYRGRGGGDVVALDGVDLSVGSGEIVGLIGQSGSGKSTLGRIAVGLDRPDAGSILLDGLPFDPARQRAAVQMVFQDPLASFNPRHDIARAIAIPLRSLIGLRRPERASEAARLLDEVGLDPSLGTRTRQGLSGGQLQRGAIARALAPKPRFLVCDEAVTSLDVSIRAQVLDLLTTLRDSMGLGILFISHDLGVVAQVADRTVVLEQGRVVEAGPTRRILEQPETESVRRLVAAIPAADTPWREARRTASRPGAPA